jgi:hypothetical protein
MNGIPAHSIVPNYKPTSRTSDKRMEGKILILETGKRQELNP